MSGTALVLAAHGSRVEPQTNALLAAMARDILNRDIFDEVTPAFHHGVPAFSSVLDGLRAREVVVAPVMTSEGYYCDEVLPRELRRNRRFAAACVRQTAPVGTHPAMTELVRRRFDALIDEYGLDPRSTCLAVVGHGTPRHARSREATERLAEALTATQVYAEVRRAFLDELPGVQNLLQSSLPALVVVPFLISGGPHATVDIPARLGMSRPPDSMPPFVERYDGRTVVCDRAIGEDPGIVDLVVELAFSELRAEACGSRSSGTGA